MIGTQYLLAAMDFSIPQKRWSQLTSPSMKDVFWATVLFYTGAELWNGLNKQAKGVFFWASEVSEIFWKR